MCYSCNEGFSKAPGHRLVFSVRAGLFGWLGQALLLAAACCTVLQQASRLRHKVQKVRCQRKDDTDTQSKYRWTAKSKYEMQGTIATDMQGHNSYKLSSCHRHCADSAELSFVMVPMHHMKQVMHTFGNIPPVMCVMTYRLSGTVLVTAETPSTNLVLKMTLALLNMPSFRDTTMN